MHYVLPMLLVITGSSLFAQQDRVVDLKSIIELADGTFKQTITKETWDLSKTAVIICDMWDKHHCKVATRRVAELAPRVQQVVAQLRSEGAHVVHCPSETMDFYRNYPQRKRAIRAPKVRGIKKLIKKAQRAGHCLRLPIKDKDGSCDSSSCNSRYSPDKISWTRQIPTIKIHDEDGIGDGPEVYYLLKQWGIENVIILGVHANKCILKRPFGIVMLSTLGMNVVFMKDLSDTMYNPENKPYVDHFVGNDLLSWYIELFWCPTLTSDHILGGEPFRFAEDTLPPRQFSEYEQLLKKRYS